MKPGTTNSNSFYSFRNYAYDFGDSELDFIGVPAPDGDGMVFTATNLRFLVSAKGNFPDQAWEFVKVTASQFALLRSARYKD